MTEKQRHIDAIFGGRPVSFAVPTESEQGKHLGLIYAATMAAPYSTLQRFALGTWSIEDLKQVLTAAYEDGKASRMSAQAEVAAVLSRNPPGNYGPLAVQILEAYLFGIDPARGTFDERPKSEAAA